MSAGDGRDFKCKWHPLRRRALLKLCGGEMTPCRMRIARLWQRLSRAPYRFVREVIVVPQVLSDESEFE